MKHIMVDLETLGNNNNAAVISIGAVEFNPNTGELGKQYYNKINVETCEEAGLSVNGSTALWWMQQSDEARAEFQKNHLAPDLSQVLIQFADYWKSVSQKNYFWAHATFDPVILRNAYEALYLKTPWHYRDVLDIRTIVALAPKDKKDDWMSAPRGGLTHHNALDDAIYQAGYVSKIWQVLYGKV